MSPTEQGAMVRIYRQEDKSVTEVWRDGRCMREPFVCAPVVLLFCIGLLQA